MCQTWTEVIGAIMGVRHPDRFGEGFDPDGLIAYDLIISELMDGNRYMVVAAYKRDSTLSTTSTGK